MQDQSLSILHYKNFITFGELNISYDHFPNATLYYHRCFINDDCDEYISVCADANHCIDEINKLISVMKKNDLDSARKLQELGALLKERIVVNHVQDNKEYFYCNYCSIASVQNLQK